MPRIPVFVIEGHDIELYPDAERAASEVESYDALALDYFGVDGTVYRATMHGRERGPVTLHETEENRLDDLIRLLRSEAEDRGLSIPPETSDTPEAIWAAVVAAQEERSAMRRSPERRRWWQPRPR